MYHWALLEGQLNTAVEKLLGLENLAGVVVTANLTFRSKLHIVQTMIELKAAKPTEWSAAAKKDLTRIADLSNVRNTVAHTTFGPPTDGEGLVQFLTVKAKGKLQFPNDVWTKETFDKHCGEMSRLRTRLEELITEVMPVRRGLLRDLIASNQLTPQPETASPPSPLLQGLLGSQSPILAAVDGSDPEQAE